MNRLSIELKENYSNVNNLFSFIDSVLIVQNINAYLKKYQLNIKSTHNKKLHNLGVNYNNLSPCDPYSVVFNFSSVVLPNRIKYLLAFGLKFCLPIYKVNNFTYFLKLESLISKLKNLHVLSTISLNF